jgi:predicted ester cyclase
MIVPGATQIEAVQPRMGERIITYHAPGSAYAWRAMVEGDLAAHGWARPLWWRPDMSSKNTYLHVSSFWFGAIWDAVELDGEPNIARISVRRWFELPWRWNRWLMYVSQHIAAYPDLHHAVEDQIAKGHTVVTRWPWTGTHQGDLLGMAPTGKPARVIGIWIHRLAGGKIVESWNVGDTLGMLQQLGVHSGAGASRKLAPALRIGGLCCSA